MDFVRAKGWQERPAASTYLEIQTGDRRIDTNLSTKDKYFLSPRILRLAASLLIKGVCPPRISRSWGCQIVCACISLVLVCVAAGGCAVGEVACQRLPVRGTTDGRCSRAQHTDSPAVFWSLGSQYAIQHVNIISACPEATDPWWLFFPLLTRESRGPIESPAPRNRR